MASGDRKYGRHKRAPSNANQALRTARNKRLHVEREEREQARWKHLGGKPMRHARGHARKLRRFGKARTSEVNIS